MRELIEKCTLGEGSGTVKPFQVLGFIQDIKNKIVPKMIADLNKENHKGVFDGVQAILGALDSLVFAYEGIVETKTASEAIWKARKAVTAVEKKLPRKTKGA